MSQHRHQVSRGSQRSTSRTVCIVDPDVSVASALGQLLHGSAAKVLSFTSAEDLLDSAVLPEVGCVVTDAQLPRMSGLELQRRLQEVAPSVPVIFLAERSDIPTAVEAVKGGAADFFEKPWIGPAVARRIRLVLNDGVPGCC